MAPDHVLVYDADCGFCRRCVAAVLRRDRDGRVRAVAMQSEEGGRLLAGMAPDDAAASWHLLLPDGRLLSAGAAVAPLAELLRGARPLARLARRFPRATARAYRWGARNRALLGRLTRPRGRATRA